MTVMGLVMAATLQFWVYTSVNLQSSQAELSTVQEKRETAQQLKQDANFSDYLLVYQDLSSLEADDSNILSSGSRGNVALFVTNKTDDDTTDESDAAIESLIAYYLEVDTETGVSSLQRVEIDQSVQGANESIGEMVTRVIENDIVQSRNIANNFEGSLDGDLFYLIEDDSIMVNGSVKDGKGGAEFSKTINLTLNVSST